MDHFMFFVEVVSELGFTFFSLLLGKLKLIFQVWNYSGWFFLFSLVLLFIIRKFLIVKSLRFHKLILVIFICFAKFSIFLREKVGLFFDFDHAFHHSHGEGVIHGPYSLNVEFELFLNAMQFYVKLPDDIFEFAFF